MIKTKYITDDKKEFDTFDDAMYHEKHLIKKSKNTAQELMFELMKIASFNGFDGEYVVNKLKERTDLWDGAVMDSNGEYYTIRDIPQGFWHVDILRITPKPNKKIELEKWVRNEIGGDEIGWKNVNKDWQGKPLEPEQLEIWWD